MQRAVLALAALVLASPIVACEARPQRAGAASADPILEPVVSARRPNVHFFMTNEADKCEVSWEDGLTRSTPIPAPCPEELLIGERYRIAGMTCIREGGAEDRHVPVVCPDPLTNLEKTYRKEHPVAP